MMDVRFEFDCAAVGLFRPWEELHVARFPEGCANRAVCSVFFGVRDTLQTSYVDYVICVEMSRLCPQCLKCVFVTLYKVDSQQNNLIVRPSPLLSFHLFSICFTLPHQAMAVTRAGVKRLSESPPSSPPLRKRLMYVLLFTPRWLF